MKNFQNTLYITQQKSYLHEERETIVIKEGDDKLGQFPVLAIGNILCFGQVSVSPFLMGYCGELMMNRNLFQLLRIWLPLKSFLIRHVSSHPSRVCELKR